MVVLNPRGYAALVFVSIRQGAMLGTMFAVLVMCLLLFSCCFPFGVCCLLGRSSSALLRCRFELAVAGLVALNFFTMAAEQLSWGSRSCRPLLAFFVVVFLHSTGGAYCQLDSLRVRCIVESPARIKAEEGVVIR